MTFIMDDEDKKKTSEEKVKEKVGESNENETIVKMVEKIK